jgi:6-phosphogluconate dehydrogenase
MGSNLAQNFASKGISTSIYNRSFDKTEKLLVQIKAKNNQALESNLHPFKELFEFVGSLQAPRKILLMVSDKAVDKVIEDLKLLLDSQDIIIDAGNSHWKKTMERMQALEPQNINFIGCGVSGGQAGALLGPSIMPGGQEKSVEYVLPLLEQVAGKDFEGQACTTNVGLGASGHFVKMVHNGIEYAIMQAIAEVYDILSFYSHTNAQIAKIFESLNQGSLQSYLLEITTQIFEAKDQNSDQYLVDMVRDTAKAKGTGAWTVESALELGVAVPSISASVFARTISARNWSFRAKSQVLPTKDQYSKQFFEDKVSLKSLELILETVFRVCYLQGLDLIFQASRHFSWNINLDEVVRIWQGGCIIRSRLLQDLHLYFKQDSQQDSQILDFASLLKDDQYLGSWSGMLQVLSGVPSPVITSSWNYLLAITNQSLPTNLIQAQRDFFGGHTYTRTDQEGLFTGGWEA